MCERPVTYRIKGLPHSWDNLVRAKCNNCEECKSQYVSRVRLRIALQLKWPDYPSQTWDLTYTDEHLPKDQKPDYKQIQLMLKRVRSLSYRRGYNTPIRYFVISEWAPETNRLHWHCIIFDLPFRPTPKDQKQLWPFGRSMMRLVKEPKKTTNYLTKYLVKDIYSESPWKPVRKWSLKPVLGERTLRKIIQNNIQQGTIPDELTPIFNFRHSDDPFEPFSPYHTPRCFMKLQRELYNEAGANFPEHTDLIKELISMGQLLAPDPIAVQQREEARKIREEMFKELKLRDTEKKQMSVKKYVDLENEQVTQTHEAPLKRKKVKLT